LVARIPRTVVAERFKVGPDAIDRHVAKDHISTALIRLENRRFDRDRAPSSSE